MKKCIDNIKSCVDCGKQITFKEFCQNNMLNSDEKAKNLYFDPLISVYCTSCYFERPEKPYKNKRRTILYFSRK